MNRRSLTSWLGLAVLVGGGCLASWLHWNTPFAEARGEAIQLAQGFRPPGMEPPLAPGIDVPAGPRRFGLPPQGAQAPPNFTGEPADPPTPHVTIRVRVPAMAHAGQPLEYRFFVQNTSQAPAHHVRVRAPLPSNSTLVDANPEPEPAINATEMIWKLGTLAGGDSKEITVRVKPTGAGDLQCCARVQFEHGECVRTRLTQPDLRVRINGPSQGLLNDNVTVVLEVTNVGQRDARGVVLTSSLPPGLDFLTSKPSTTGNNPLTWDLGTIPPGQSQRVEYQAVVAKTGTLVTKAEVKDDAGLKQTASAQLEVGEPRLNLAVVGPKKRIVGRPTAFQITVSNPGTRPATHVELAYDVPPDITLVNASQGGQLQGNTVRWKLGTLAPGSKQTVQMNLQARKEGELVNRPTATADRGLIAHAESHTFFEGATGLALEIDKAPDPLEVGQTGKITLRVTNQGSKDAKNLTVTLTLPAELQVKEIKGGGFQDGPKVSFKMDALATGAEATFIIMAQALRAADARLRSDLTSDDLKSGPIHFEESITLHSDSPPLVPQPPR
jgi:uncharacterized repeat protein (TIGR01451 family)